MNTSVHDTLHNNESTTKRQSQLRIAGVLALIHCIACFDLCFHNGVENLSSSWKVWVNVSAMILSTTVGGVARPLETLAVQFAWGIVGGSSVLRSWVDCSISSAAVGCSLSLILPAFEKGAGVKLIAWCLYWIAVGIPPVESLPGMRWVFLFLEALLMIPGGVIYLLAEVALGSKSGAWDQSYEQVSNETTMVMVHGLGWNQCQWAHSRLAVWMHNAACKGKPIRVLAMNYHKERWLSIFIANHRFDDSIQRYSQTLGDFIKGIECNEVVLVGHSTGGIIAAYYAEHMAEVQGVRVPSVVALASPFDGSTLITWVYDKGPQFCKMVTSILDWDVQAHVFQQLLPPGSLHSRAVTSPHLTILPALQVRIRDSISSGTRVYAQVGMTFDGFVSAESATWNCAYPQTCPLCIQGNVMCGKKEYCRSCRRHTRRIFRSSDDTFSTFGIWGLDLSRCIQKQKKNGWMHFQGQGSNGSVLEGGHFSVFSHVYLLLSIATFASSLGSSTPINSPKATTTRPYQGPSGLRSKHY